VDIGGKLVARIPRRIERLTIGTYDNALSIMDENFGSGVMVLIEELSQIAHLLSDDVIANVRSCIFHWGCIVSGIQFRFITFC
jgi:hypothetical protein